MLLTLPVLQLIRSLIAPLAAVALLAACTDHPKEAALPATSPVLALGDSLTAGPGVAGDQAWPALLERKTGWAVVNSGVNGNTSADALQRLPDLLDQHAPVLVLVTLGGNDMLRHVPATQTVANLTQILELVKAHGSKAVLLATPEPTVMGAAFHTLSPPAFYREIAQAQQVPLIEDAIAEVLSDPQLKADPLHPNAAGHALLADKIYRQLQAIGYAR